MVRMVKPKVYILVRVVYPKVDILTLVRIAFPYMF